MKNITLEQVANSLSTIVYRLSDARFQNGKVVPVNMLVKDSVRLTGTISSIRHAKRPCDKLELTRKAISYVMEVTYLLNLLTENGVFKRNKTSNALTLAKKIEVTLVEMQDVILESLPKEKTTLVEQEIVYVDEGGFSEEYDPSAL